MSDNREFKESLTITSNSIILFHIMIFLEVKMKRRQFLKSLGAASVAMTNVSLINGACSQSRKPNIVLIYADDLDFDEISPYDYRKYPCYTGAQAHGFYRKQKDGWFVQNNRRLPWGDQGYFDDPRMLTPNIERLANEGAMLEHFYITTATCTPSRYTLLTGRLASRNPVLKERVPADQPVNLSWNTPIAPDETHIASELKKAGYKTGFVGKWHNGTPPHDPANQVAEDADPHDPVVLEKMRAEYDKDVEHIREKIGFDFVERVYARNKENMNAPKFMRVHNLEWITEGALKFIDEQAENPFFLYMPITVPHGQYYSDWLEENTLATPIGLLDKHPDCMPTREDILSRVDKLGIPHRNAMGTWMDDSVGAVMKKLEDLGQFDNTVFIFTSDHQSRGKFTCYEGCRVPFIIRWPGKVGAGSRIDAYHCNADIARTLIELAGGIVPDDMKLDGRSMLPALAGKSGTRDTVFLETAYTRAIISGKYKYMANRPPQDVLDQINEQIATIPDPTERDLHWSGRHNWHVDEGGVVYGPNRDFPAYYDMDQLYDLEQDPFEQVNLIDKPEYSEIVADLKAKMTQQLNRLPHAFGEFKQM